MAEYYPRWVAGEDITADQLNAMLPKVVRKTADTSRASTATPSADPELQITLDANAVYVWDGWLKYFADPAGDLQIDFTAPSGTLGEWVGFGAGSSTSGAAATTGYLIRTETNDIMQSRSYYGTTNGTHGVLLQGTIRTSSTSGTFSLDWAQGSSDATATVVYTDSWLRFQRIA